MERMSAKEVRALVEWLKEHGHDSDEIVDCVTYIADHT